MPRHYKVGLHLRTVPLPGIVKVERCVCYAMPLAANRLPSKQQCCEGHLYRPNTIRTTLTPRTLSSRSLPKRTLSVRVTSYTLRLHCRLCSLRHLSVRPLLAFGRLVFTLPCLLPQLWTLGMGINNFVCAAAVGVLGTFRFQVRCAYRN